MTALARAKRSADLLPIEQARAILERCTKVDEVKRIADQTEAIRLYLRRQGAARATQNHATEILLHSQARLGELTSALPKARGGRGKTGPKAGPVLKLATLAAEGISKQDASRWKQLAEAKRSGKLDDHIAAVKARNEKLTVSGAIGAVSFAVDYESDEWGTAPGAVALVRRVLRRIDLDSASNARAQKIVQARRFYTKRDDGLSLPWRGCVYCNPPFSIGGDFVDKFIEEVCAKRVRAGIMLLNAYTDTAWYHELASRFLVCHTRGRLAFLRPDGKPVAGNRVGQVFAYAGAEPDRFVEVFNEIGIVLERRR